MLVLVGGPPASGKTSLCQGLSIALHAQHMDADEFIRNCDHQRITYKQERARLYGHVQSVVLQQPLLSVVLEDCFHLKSMRKPYVKLARQFKVPFGIVWINTIDPHVLCERDAKRDKRVGQATIERLLNCLEPPVPADDVFFVNHSTPFESIVDFCIRLSMATMSGACKVLAHEPCVLSCKHKLNLSLCRLSGLLIRQLGFDPIKCCKCKRVIMRDKLHALTLEEKELEKLFITEYNLLDH